ncbi:MAG: translocation/assembly module TamB [Gemmatimonadetes bacterium]|nr:translocation/assembly module TamB [Gemmatimonadota bacterium]
MRLRRLVLISAAFAFGALFGAAGLAAYVVTSTQVGRDWVRELVVAQLKGSVKGSLYVGSIGGTLLGDVTVDSLDLRDKLDSVFVRTGPVHFTYDVRDLIDRKIVLKKLELTRPFIRIKEHGDADWNWRKIFPPSKATKPRLTPGVRDFGDWVVIDSMELRDGTVLLVQPWHPDDSLSGARRDSAIKDALRRKDVEIRADSEGYMKTRRWTGAQIWTGRLRIAYPDSVGQQFTVRKLDIVENDPPFRISDAHGLVRKNDDSLWVTLDRFRLPHTVAKGGGKIWWGGGIPMRWNLTFESDTAGMADFAWIDPSIPETGGGKVKVAVHNKRGNLDAMEYVLTGLDARSERSRLMGTMTFTSGEPVLGFSNVNLVPAPANFDLLRRFNRGPFPYDWQGNITGTLKASGGPVNHWKVDEARLTFADAGVPGAESRFVGRGELDILFPAFTAFHGFDLEVKQFDLRTAQRLNPDFPRLMGFVRGRLVLDSMWQDVRFSRATIVHADGDGDTTVAVGSGRITLPDEGDNRYELNVRFPQLALTTVARSYPMLPFRGNVRGPLTTRGTADSLEVESSEGLSGDAGTIAFAGTVDTYPPGYAFRGQGTFENLDLHLLTQRRSVPSTSLFGSFVLDVSGDSLANLAGTAAVDAGRGLVEGSRLYSLRASLAMADGRLRVDTVRAEGAALSLSAGGGLGLVSGQSDSLRILAFADSLGGFRRFLALDSASRGVAALDSLAGSLALDATLTGHVGALGAHARLDGKQLLWQGSTVKGLTATLEATDLSALTGLRARVELDTLKYGALAAQTVRLDATAADTGNASLALAATFRPGTDATLRARIASQGDTARWLLDAFEIGPAENRWRLMHPAAVSRLDGAVTMDTIELRGSRTGWLRVSGRLADVDTSTDLRLDADSLPVGDLAALAGADARARGTGRLAARVRGSRGAPVMALDAEVRGARLGPGPLGAVRLTGRYADRALSGTLDLRRDTAVALSGTVRLPVDLALEPRTQRLLDDSLAARFRSVAADLSLVESFTGAIADASGKLDVDLTVGGRWSHPRLDGRVRVTDGAARIAGLGRVTVEQLGADLRFLGDSMAIQRLDARSVQTRLKSGRRTGTLALTGGISFADWADPVFGLHLVAGDFNVIDQPGVADVDVSGDLRLTGPLRAAVLDGQLTVDRGAIYIRDLAQKRIVSLEDPALYRSIDSGLVAGRRGPLPQATSGFTNALTLRDVRVTMGSDVWLRSSEANINLDGGVRVTRRRSLVGLDSAQAEFTLDGALLVRRGTYRLNVGEIVQRTFEVERGTIRFFGEDAQVNPALDITAVHTVRKFNSSIAQQDRKIRAKIGGTLETPTLDFESADDAKLSQSDLISYLVTGGPALGVGDPTQQNGVGNTAANALITTVGSALSDKLAGLGLFDVVTIQTALDQGNTGAQQNRDVTQQLLANTRVGGGIQLTDRTYLSGNVGLCNLANGTSQAFTISDLLGLRVEYRVNSTYALSASVAPSTVGQLCDRNNPRGFAVTPQQLGFDFTGTWRF